MLTTLRKVARRRRRRERQEGPRADRLAQLVEVPVDWLDQPVDRLDQLVVLVEQLARPVEVRDDRQAQLDEVAVEALVD